MVRKIALAMALVLASLMGGEAPAQASHNPTMGCWFIEGTDWNDPSWGWHWEYYPNEGGWWRWRWWEHWEECEDGWWDNLGLHQHWDGPYGY